VRIQILLLAIMVLFSGCTKLKHLPQLLTLKKYSEEQEEINALVNEHDKKFKQMLAEINTGEIHQHKTGVDLKSIFGDPILIKKSSLKGNGVEIWLYRYSKGFFKKDKVYFTLSLIGEVISFEYVKGEETK